MRTRGRISAEALTVITPGGVETTRRPMPPDDLDEDQAEEWRAVVNRLPAEWFPRETHGMLAQYCRHVVMARRVADMIRSLESEIAAEAAERGASAAAALLGAVKAIDRLLKMQEREGRAISSLATKMRISQQATYDKSKRKPTAAKRPWEE